MTAAKTDTNALLVPLQSDPPWLGSGLLLTTAVSLAGFAIYFSLLAAPKPSLWLSLIPGLATATFAGSGLAWWGRRRGHTISIEATPHKVSVVGNENRERVLDRKDRFGAMLLIDKSSSLRALVLSQGNDPVIILDDGATAPLSPGWQGRTLRAELSGVALSSSSSGVLAIALPHSMDSLLRELEADLAPETPWMQIPLPGGEILRLTSGELSLGTRVAHTKSGSGAGRFTMETSQGRVPALSIPTDEGTILLACPESTEHSETLGEESVPDGYLPPALFATIAIAFGVDGSTSGLPGQPYRG